VDQLRGHLLLAAWVLIGSALPFVPTGEMVSAAAAVASHSNSSAWLIFGITWICSVLGDTIMLAEFRWSARWTRPWTQRGRLSGRINQAQEALSRNAFHAILTGRLIPGGRTPVIAALGLSHYPVRRFLPASILACGVWSAIYASIGTIGGRVADQPFWSTLIAIGFALSIGLLVQQIRRWLERRSERRAEQEVVEDGLDARV
jgi:membrane protein DedA with SNARE-associated domain